jgi:hypothetical protein
MYPTGGPEMGQEVADLSSIINEIFRFVIGAARSMEIGEMERHLLRMAMYIGRQALGEIVAAKGTGCCATR